MKKIIIFALLGFIAGIPVGCVIKLNTQSLESQYNARIIEEARKATFQLDLDYNRLYDIVAKRQLFNSENANLYEAAQSCLRSLNGYIINVNKSLKIDCRSYSDNVPVTIVFDSGEKEYLEKVPDVMRIVE